MIPLNSVSPARLYSAAVEKLSPHRLTIIFGLAVLGVAAAGYYVYRRLYPSLHDLCKQAFEKGEYQKVVDYCETEFSRLDRIDAPLDSALNIVPYFWRNAVDLKTGKGFLRVIDSCDKASKCKMNDQLKAQFFLQEMEARCGLNEPTKVMQKNIELLKPFKLLGQAYYLLGLAYKGREDSSAIRCCDKALEHIPDQDLELNVKVLALKSLVLLDMRIYQEAAEAGHSALRLFHPNRGQVSKETLVVLYFSLALSEYTQKKYGQGISDFEKALKCVDENDQYLRNLLTFQSRYFRARFAESYTDAQTALREAEEAYNACNGKSDDRRFRSELVRCLIRIIVKGYLDQGSSLLPSLARRNESLQRTT